MSTAASPLRSMAERYTRPDWVRRINCMADAVGGDARRLIRLDAAELLAAAAADLGGMPAGDFGDPKWQSRFAQLVAALDAADMHVVGRLMTKEELLRGLRTRLLLSAAVDRDPTILAEKIEAPLVVTGPARSGTTILFELLWLDPGLRAPVASDALHPLPFRGEERLASRHERSQCEQEFWADVQPEFAAIHELRSDLPVECVTLTQPSFCGSHWAMIAQPAGWEMDIEADYHYHRGVLQVMQRSLPHKNWLLKTPAHLATLEALFATYPDAWVLQTHRDPAKTMPSTASTTAMVQWMRTDSVDLTGLCAAIETVFGFALNHSVELRQSDIVPRRFVDVHFQSLMKDPVETLRAAYATMERELSAEHAERIRRYLAEKPRGKFGTHQYTPEEWGFSAAGLRTTLAPYIEFFGVALE
jgi:hypothetical protein